MLRLWLGLETAIQTLGILYRKSRVHFHAIDLSVLWLITGDQIPQSLFYIHDAQTERGCAVLYYEWLLSTSMFK